MLNKHVFPCLLVTALAFSYAPAKAASTSYKGSAQTSSTRVQMPLAGGGTVMTANATGFAAMTASSTPNPILFALRCSGLGYVTADDSDGSIELYCTFVENKTDQFDVKGTEKSGETAITVIGGSGRWANATGSGTLKRTSTSINSSNSTFTLTIDTP